MDIFKVFDLIGTGSFAIAGVMASRRFRPDFIGALILAFATATGGGIIRDAIICRPAVFFKSQIHFWVIIVSTIVAIIWADHIRRTKNVLNIMDAIGLGFFNAAGVMAGLNANLSYEFAIILGAMTGCGGGIIRDVLCAQMPTLLLPREIYISTCIVASVIGLTFHHFGSSIMFTTVFITIITIVLRIFAIIFKWKMPSIAAH